MHHGDMNDRNTHSSPLDLGDSGSLLRPQNPLPDRRWARFLLWSRRMKLGGRFELFLAVLSIISAIATFLALSRGAAPSEITEGNLVQILLRVNGILLICLAAILCRWFLRLWVARRSSAPGSRLHTRVTGVFIAIAVVPPIVMAIFSALFLEFGLQTWFSDKVRNTLSSALEVVQAYMVEHRQDIEQDLAAISFAYSRLTPDQLSNPTALQNVGETALNARSLSELMVIEEWNGEGRVLVRENANALGLATSRIDLDLIDQARSGGRVVTFSRDDGTIVGIQKVSSFFRPTYLYVARDLNPRVIDYLQATQAAVESYETLEGRRSDVQLQFNVVFVIVALLILLAAIWVGLRFSSRLVTPLSNLVDAAERVGRGDLDARVPNLSSADELGSLSRAFNRMTDQLSAQQAELKDTNRTLDDRRRFLEDVLEGVSAGVIGLDGTGYIFLANASASEQLGVPADQLVGALLSNLNPGFSDLLEETVVSDPHVAVGKLSFERDGDERTLLVRISASEAADGLVDGFVVTFDDLTDQLADQRTAAWADVARRIAHEIKNPLTPIQLSAERLKKKYRNDINGDVAVFEQCTDTIVRQVGDLRRMVDEFSSFARMPTPMFKSDDLVDVIRQCVFLQDVAWPSITFNTSFDSDTAVLEMDSRLIGQAVTNVLKNAAESVAARADTEGMDYDGHVDVTLEVLDKQVRMVVRDNGLGLPKEEKRRLTEPYVTTRRKGTGLGLAIVKRILEDHGGTVRIVDRAIGGARVELSLNYQALAKKAAQAHAAE